MMWRYLAALRVNSPWSWCSRAPLRESRRTPCWGDVRVLFFTALKSTLTLGNKLSEPHQHLQRLDEVSWFRWTSTGFRACCFWWCRSMSRTSKIPLDTLHGVVLRLIWDSWPSQVTQSSCKSLFHSKLTRPILFCQRRRRKRVMVQNL